MISFSNDLKDLRAFDCIFPSFFFLFLTKRYKESIVDKCHAAEREVDNRPLQLLVAPWVIGGGGVGGAKVSQPFSFSLFFFFLNKFIYLFIFGCVGSSFLCEGFL